MEVLADTKLAEYIKMWKQHIMSEVRSKSMELVMEVHGEMVGKWEIEGEKVEIGVSSMNLKDSIKELAKIPGITAKAAEALVDAGVRTEVDLRQLGEKGRGDRQTAQADVRRALHHSDRSAETCKAVPEGTGTTHGQVRDNAVPVCASRA